MPESEEMKTFYTLGVNIARQVGGELKTMLTKEEIEVMLSGFNDSMNDKVENDQQLLVTYGPKLNEILQSRAMGAVTEEKKKGAEYVTKYLLSNPKAVQTSSGLIYNEIIAGAGTQVLDTEYFIFL